MDEKKVEGLSDILFSNMGERGPRHEGKPQPELFPDIFRESWLYRKFPDFLKAYFVAHWLAYPVHEELLARMSDIPRDIRTALYDRDPEEVAEATMQEFKEELEKGEPLPIDLLTFYLQQEQDAGGVSEEDRKAAKKRFDEIIGYAQEMQGKGAKRDEVLGFVLKQQGHYNDRSSLLTDLLIRGEGECEARQRYISAAVQKLYPEDVAAGHMKTQVYGGYVDESGRPQNGHVRVIIDEGKGQIDVLEGDAVQHQPASMHKDIPAHETTQLAVKSFAAHEGVYDFGKDKIIEKDELKRLDVSEAMEFLASNALKNNSVADYPASEAEYPAGRVVNVDIDPKPVRNRWNASRMFESAIELELRPERPDLTLDFVKQHPEFYTDGGTIRLDKYKALDPEALKVIINHRDRGYFKVRLDQELPVELFQGKDASFEADLETEKSDGTRATLQGIEAEGLRLNGQPRGSLAWLSTIEWVPGSTLSYMVSHSQPQGLGDDIDATLNREQWLAMLRSGASVVSIGGRIAVDTHGGELEPPPKLLFDVGDAVGDHGAIRLAELSIHSLEIDSWQRYDAPLDGVAVSEIKYTTSTDDHLDFLIGAQAEHVTVYWERMKFISATPAARGVLRPSPGALQGIKNLEIVLRSGELGKEAFRGANLETLTLWYPSELQSSMFEDSNIRRVLIKTDELIVPESNRVISQGSHGPRESIVIKCGNGVDPELLRKNVEQLRAWGPGVSEVWKNVPVYIIRYFDDFFTTEYHLQQASEAELRKISAIVMEPEP